MCVCARSSWPGWVGRPPGLLSGAPHLTFGRCVLRCSAPSGLGLPFFVSLFAFYRFCCLFFSFLHLPAPPLFLTFSGFRPLVSWALALCCPFPPGSPVLSFFFLALVFVAACLLWCLFSPALFSPPPTFFSSSFLPSCFSSLPAWSVVGFLPPSFSSSPRPPPPSPFIPPPRCAPFGLVFCGALLPCSVLLIVLWCPGLSGCGLPWVFVFSIVLCRAVGWCCVLCRVSGHVVPLRCSRCGLLSRFGLPCCVV